MAHESMSDCLIEMGKIVAATRILNQLVNVGQGIPQVIASTITDLEESVGKIEALLAEVKLNA